VGRFLRHSVVWRHLQTILQIRLIPARTSISANSFIYDRNSKGPIPLPCTTPLRSCITDDQKPCGNLLFPRFWLWLEFCAKKIAICRCACVAIATNRSTMAISDSQRIFLQFSFSISSIYCKLECGPMPNVMVALPNIGGALCSTPQSLADAHY